jgi:hypothetical protein
MPKGYFSLEAGVKPPDYTLFHFKVLLKDKNYTPIL